MKTLKELVEEIQNPKYLEKIAIIDRREYRKFEYTYSQLYNLSRKFASFLKENNIKKGDKIIIWSPNGIEYVATLFGAFLEGIIVVPVDVKSNIDFVKKIQKQVDAKMIIQTRYNPKSNEINTIFIEQLLNILANIKIKENNIKINENDIAQINYTSGTTGEPKGVILTNKNIISNINSLNEMQQVRTQFKFLSALPLSHMFEQTVGLLLPITHNATIVYIKTLKLSSLFEAFEQEKPTHMIVVPRLLQLIHSGIIREVKEKEKEKQFSLVLGISKRLPRILKKKLFRKIHKSLGNNLQYFVCGGSTLEPDLEKFYDTIGLPIVQGYGLTETSPVLTNNTIDKRKYGSVGKAIPGIKIKISKGDVLAKGNNITSGYYKNPIKTKELFSGTWLKTGDIGNLDNDGFLYLKGRRKDIIVTAAGINIYPEDIERILNKMPQVKDSCVIGIKTQTGEKIHSVLLLEKGVDPTSADKIITEANSKLETSKQIKGYSLWKEEDFPRTTTMKIKKFIVKETIQQKTASPEEKPSENKIYRIISKLTSKKINPASTLQSLGLSSIDRVELISSLEQEFNTEIDEEEIIPSTTIKDIERLAREKKKIEKKSIFKKWALSTPLRIIRFMIQQIIVLPLLIRVFCKIKIEGKENLSEIKGPVIFTSNHQSYYDTGVILTSLPLKWSQNIAIATWREYFFNPDLSFKNFFKKILFYAGLITFNIYSFPVEKGYKKSMKYTGNLIEKGWNILIFPEGRRTRTGKISSFKQGIGILAVEMKVPIVPIKLENVRNILSIGKAWPKFGTVTIKIGKPINVKTNSYIEATGAIETAVRKL
jgi:long-chain acyl-CoA synthetase